jgi:hypothetical protein
MLIEQQNHEFTPIYELNQTESLLQILESKLLISIKVYLD